MNRPEVFSYIEVDEFSATPKYLQLSSSILKAVEAGKLAPDTLMPSINELSFELDISRDTAEKGYRKLKKMGVLGSVPGKGYFIKEAQLEPVYNICLLFNKLSKHKKIIYDSFVANLGSNVAIDFYIYNNDFNLFKRLLQTKKEGYSHFVIIPHFLEGGENAWEVINTIDKDKLILLDKKLPEITGDYAAVYENFSEDIFKALEQAKEKLSNYSTLKLIFPSDSYYPMEIYAGFEKFCLEYAFAYKIVGDIEQEEINEGEVYINLKEDDLITLIERVIGKGLRIGMDVGIISYNEVPLKKLILDGITTMSTDFEQMGKITAELILENRKDHVEVPFHLILRNSL